MYPNQLCVAFLLEVFATMAVQQKTEQIIDKKIAFRGIGETFSP
jgi:hypothetical protein